MADLGLGGAYGAGGAADALKDVIKQRLLERQVLAQQALEQQKLQQQNTLTRLAIQERADAARQRAEVARGLQQDRVTHEAQGIADTLPPDTFVGESDPAVAKLQGAGYG